MEESEEEYKKRWKELLEEARQKLKERRFALVAEYHVECDGGSCVYDYHDIFVFKKFEDANMLLKDFIRECDVVDFKIHYDTGIDAWILEIIYHSHKH
jgi:hypothetical protein